MLLLVRPQQSLQASLDNFQEQGFSCVGLAVQAIKFDTQQSKVFERDSTHFQQNKPANKAWFDFIIITSQFAVEGLAKQLTKSALTLSDLATQFICIGDATALAIHKLNPSIQVIVPEQQNSEGILDLPVFANIENQRVAILKGEGGRKLIAKELTTRGAAVSEYTLYKRTKIEPNVNQLATVNPAIEIVVVASGEAAIILLEQPQLAHLKRQTWVVNSQRIAKLIKQHGVSSVYISAGASDSALIKCIQQIME